MTTRGARVVRDAVELAAVAAGCGEPLEPRARVRERRLLEAQVLERPGGHVLRHLGVPHLDDVGRRAARQGGVELLEVVPPRLVLDVHRDAGMIFLERGVGRLHDRLPVRCLCVRLQPDGDAVRRLRAARGGRRDNGKGDADENGGPDDACSHGRYPQAHREAERVARISRWPIGSWDVAPLTGLYHLATIRKTGTRPASCQDHFVPEELHACMTAPRCSGIGKSGTDQHGYACPGWPFPGRRPEPRFSSVTSLYRSPR